MRTLDRSVTPASGWMRSTAAPTSVSTRMTSGIWLLVCGPNDRARNPIRNFLISPTPPATAARGLQGDVNRTWPVPVGPGTRSVQSPAGGWLGAPSHRTVFSAPPRAPQRSWKEIRVLHSRDDRPARSRHHGPPRPAGEGALLPRSARGGYRHPTARRTSRHGGSRHSLALA